MEWVIVTGYVISLTIICVFSLGQLNLTLHFLKSRKRVKPVSPITSFPFVTIQLPIYNEKYVVARLIDAVCDIDYPGEQMEIQLLDDSTDETKEIISAKVSDWKDRGIDIHHIRRSDRAGFKAGALQYGLERSNGEFIAIFDADFLPHRKFLKDTLSHFNADNVGMVQTRWSHLNEEYNLLTRMQAFGLDAHFTIEQQGRNAAGSFISFNGTGGIWRKACIEEAGGWHFDTLTEDLDLSYRAQLKGWKFEYVDEIDSPAELPVMIPAVKSQQYRWNKGAAETAKKNIGKILSSDLKWVHKVRAIMHLLNSSVFLFLLVAAIFSIPMLYVKENNPALQLIFDLGSIFIIGFIAIGIFYWVSTRARHPDKSKWFYIQRFPLFLTFSMGLALHNSIAIVEGLFGIKTPFIRTPKFNVRSKNDRLVKNDYIRQMLKPSVVFEGILAVYFVFGIIAGIILGDYGLIFFHVMLMVGFGYVFAISVKPIRYAA